MDYRIIEIEGIGPAYGKKLSTAGIETTGQVIRVCGSLKGRRQIAKVTGLREEQLLKWANMADLMRISGIGQQFSELLEASGVDTVKELKQRKAKNLAAKLREVNAARKLTRKVPSEARVADWVEQAKGLTPAVTH